MTERHCQFPIAECQKEFECAELIKYQIGDWQL
jgi:hypothetical protein